jgi:hypothetical protein
VEAAQRMLGLVEATEQELAAQGQEGSHGDAPDISSIQAGQEVRPRDSAEGALHAL